MEKDLRQFILIGHLAILFVCCVLIGACRDRHDQVLLTGDEAFRDGDLVLRCGYGAESRLVTESSQSNYSHIGILHFDSLSARWMVIHSVPFESDDDPEWVKQEPIEEFFSYDKAVRGAWMRVDCPDRVASKAAQYALGKVEAHVEFDNDYLLSDTTRLYCSELVWQAYLHQGVDVSDGHRHDVPSFISKECSCIFPCDIQESKRIQYYQPLKTVLQ